MRKLVWILILTLLLSGSNFLLYGDKGKVYAENIDLSTLISKFPAFNQDVFYSFTNHQIQYALSATVVSFFNGTINIDAGYTPASEIVALASIKLIDLGTWVTFPIAKYIVMEPFFCIGATNLIGDSQKKFDYGAGVKIISIKF
jgi:hypothetical protein